MAKDPSKKGVRKIPPQFLEWIEAYYGDAVANWYKKTTGTGKAEATKQRQRMSDIVGATGAFHEGHFQGAKDFDPEMGGGPTTGRTLRPEIGVTNVAHAEKPRISKADMRRLGIPQFWVEDFYEAILESEGQRVIGNLDVQGALDVDRGMPVEQAAAQTRFRDDLRVQGENIPGSRYTGTDKPAPITQVPTETPRAPKFDASNIKTGTGIPQISGESRVTLPRNAVKIDKGVARLVPGFGVAVGLSAMGERAQAGDFEGVVGEGIAAVVGEIPFIGDALVMEAEGRAAGERLPENITPDQFTQMQIQRAKNLKSIPEQISNEAKWAVNNPSEAIKNVTEAGLTTALAAGKQAFDSPMLAPYTTPIKAINGAMKFFGF